MRRIELTFVLSLLCLVGLRSQSIWNVEHLKEVKQHIAQPAYAAAHRELLKNADHLLTLEPLSVMMKDKTPASGDKHDYMSQARYFWPDPEQPDGLPYIQLDGESNPELEKLDRVRLGVTANRITTLSLAWYFSGEGRYAQKATELIRVWFLDKATRMNPNMNYAQVVPGRFEDKGRCYGVIDALSFVEMLDGVQLLEQSEVFTARDSKNLKAWFTQFLNWMLTSEQGIEEGKQKNNHAVAYDTQVIAFALYTGNKEVARKVIEAFPAKRIFTQIEPDGRQPEELRRTLAFGYSQYNLSHMIDIFLMAQKLGLSIDQATSTEGRSFYKAVDFMAPYFGKEQAAWPYEQIAEWDLKQNLFGQDLYRVYLLNPSRTDYLQLYQANRKSDFSDDFVLKYLKADVTDHAFAFAQAQLKYAIACTQEARKESKDKTLVSPRTVEKDGSLRIVRPRDWCSGFFPGNLWQTFAYTNSEYWQQEAVAHTWPLEALQWERGTHDLGFMVYNSFGQAWHLTGEQSYKDVALQAARSLITRYREKVGAIRSWDHNRHKWQYPVIIDNMMNLELLFWATQETGDSIYHRIAVRHADTTLKHHFRADYSSYHVVDYDTLTGNVISRQTHQGIADESVWSRGQAWGLYGYTMCYRFTQNPAYLNQARKIAAFYFAQPDMPADLVPYWDMKDPAIPQSPRDASAAAIVASGLYELAGYVSGDERRQYLAWANTIVDNLSAHYQAAPGTEKGFLLLHSTGNYPSDDEIDVPIVYADYYYLEALLRRRNHATLLPTSPKTRLSEGWEFIRQDMGSIWEVMRPAKEGQPESVPLWSPVTLPHCFNAEDAVDPDVNYYQGPGWYRTQLAIDNPYPNGRVFLEFEGAGQQTDVYIHTTQVGTHLGGYDGWKVDITDVLPAQKGTIPVAIRCDNTRRTGIIPSDMSDFNLYGGLYRYVNLVYVPVVSFERIKIDASVDEKGREGAVKVTVVLYNPEQEEITGTLSIRVKDPGGKEIYKNSLTQTLKGELTPADLKLKKPQLWDVNAPQLYTVELTLDINGQQLQATDRFGFRHFEFVENGPFKLNGRRLLLRGTHRHEDHAGVAAALTEETMVREMKLIKAMGANFIRLGHYQQSDIILRLCDELGILVWEEIPWCRGGLGGEEYQQQTRRMLTNMIEQHYNHPSVILWGLGNENDWRGDFEYFDPEAIRTFMKELHDLSHRLDDSRLTAIRRCEFCKDIVDVYSPTIWPGWYSRKFTDYREMSEAGFQGTTRFLHAEWGGDSHARRHAEGDFKEVTAAAKNGDWSESYIIRLFDWHLKEQENMPALTGTAFWTFKDFSTPLRPENPVPYVNQKGVVERDLNPKESYYVFQSYWAEEPMLHIYGHTWPVRWGGEGEKKEVLVYSNCAEVELFVNGISQGKKKRNSRDFPAAGLRWNVEYAEGMNELKAIAHHRNALLTDEIHQEYQTAPWGTPAKLRLTAQQTEAEGTLLIKAELLDAHGVRCLDAQDPIEFEALGGGKLLQNQGTSTGSRRVQAYNGRAEILLLKKDKSSVPAHILAKSGNITSELLSTFAP